MAATLVLSHPLGILLHGDLLDGHRAQRLLERGRATLGPAELRRPLGASLVEIRGLAREPLGFHA